MHRKALTPVEENKKKTMLLSITMRQTPATDLGYLLHKNPDVIHEKALSFGRAVVFYPVACEDCCTATVLLDVDPVALVRGKDAWSRGLFGHYITDRPYATSSFLSVAIARLFGTAMSGRSKSRQALADQAVTFEITVAPLPCRGGAELLKRLFTPLGYDVTWRQEPLDKAHPEWGLSVYVAASLKVHRRLADVLSHLFVLLPVLDDQKHYFVSDDEVEKLVRKGAGWLEEHPERTLITERYLKHQQGLTQAALDELGGLVEPGAQSPLSPSRPEQLRLNDLRADKVTAIILESGAQRVLDLGCGDGKLLQRWIAEPQFTHILGLDVSLRSLQLAAKRLKLELLSERARSRINLQQGSLVYRDARLEGYDAAALVEVIEHLELEKLTALETSVFAQARPALVVVTTPNRDFNATFETQGLRHDDHRFEWSRAEFVAWANSVAARQKYQVRFDFVGPEHPAFGAPTQLAVFTR